jgi:hypothetical protein
MGSSMRVHIKVTVECRRCGRRRAVDQEGRDYAGLLWGCTRAILPPCDCPALRSRVVTGFAVIEDAGL